MYALTRLQADKGAWYWGVHFRRNGQPHYRRFYDTKYGGNRAARKAAIAWRDERMAITPVLTMVQFCQQKRSHNTSGVPGVHFLTSPAQPQGYWQAKLKLGGKARHKSFSVLKHGWQNAYEQAVAAREQMLAQAQAQDRPYLYDELAKKVAAKASANTSAKARKKAPP